MPDNEKTKCICEIKVALIQATATIVAAIIEKSGNATGGSQVAEAEIPHVMKLLAKQIDFHLP